jgi:hypothetical protein
MRFNWFYLLMVFVLRDVVHQRRDTFAEAEMLPIGLAQSIPYKINSEKSALVKTVPVSAGMQVKKAMCWMKLTSQELEIEIAKLTNRIAS